MLGETARMTTLPPAWMDKVLPMQGVLFWAAGLPRCAGNDKSMTPMMPTISPQEFVAKWDRPGFTETQAAQEMFLDVCALVGHATPVAYGNEQAFTFEKQVPGGGKADAYFEERFVWEFKTNDNQLDQALTQAVGYARHLKNPPLIVVSSFNTIRIETNFQGMELVRRDIAVSDLARPDNIELLRKVFHDPNALRPDRSVADVTRQTADLFSRLVADMEDNTEDQERLARYLNQLVFCLYSEDAGLLPEGLFTRIVAQNFRDPETFDGAIRGLFNLMATGGFSGADRIAQFNGDLFNTVDTVELSTTALQRLGEACAQNWRSIEPSIFGTLFERALDASKRAQTGAHYTGADDIELVVEPVVMTPLRREWETAKQEVNDLIDEDDDDVARARLEAFRERLASVKVLDPACGSGNFLYIALRSLLDLEREVIDFATAKGWNGMTPTVQPDQMLGLEINHYAAELARTALWIGYIQWHQANGFAYTQRPILTPLDTIRQTDAILDLSDPDNPAEPEWPAAEFIVGNPPFLGNKLLRAHLGDAYVEAMFALYGDRLPGGSDLVCYWFEKARALIEAGLTNRAGLLATQGVRGEANRTVLQRIKGSGDIFLAYPDRPWVLNGAAVHVSIVGFDNGTQTGRELDGSQVSQINPDLTSGPDLTHAVRLEENADTAFNGTIKAGPFDITDAQAKDMLASTNPHGASNRDVIKPWVNARDITTRSRRMWIIDFQHMSFEEAALYEAPFEYVNEVVRPIREANRDKNMRTYWWRLGRNRGELQKAIEPLRRLIVTPRVAKHRVFVWVSPETSPDTAIVAVARDDDFTLGVLQSRVHELWARATGTQLREAESGFRYSHTATFETFPFPRPTEEQREAIGAIAAELNRLREGWLNPEGVSAAELKRRTLTNLYNQRPTWLDNIHARLDAAVADAYGWPADLADGDILERLLALNLERAGE